MILHFIRHGQTDFNKTGTLQGKAFDEPINAEGEKEIREVLPTIPSDFEVIFASPLKRVQMSAEIISSYFDKPIITKEELSERDLGSLAGKTWDELPDGRELQKIDQDQEYDYRQYGGESAEDVTLRTQQFLDYAKASGYDSALVVSSVGVVRIIYKLLRNEKVIRIENATVHTFTI
jgi:broad specificity phosphatase PhoE